MKVYKHLNFKRNIIMLQGPCLNGEAKNVQNVDSAIKTASLCDSL